MCDLNVFLGCGCHEGLLAQENAWACMYVSQPQKVTKGALARSSQQPTPGYIPVRCWGTRGLTLKTFGK